jgi:hypothetical protein
MGDGIMAVFPNRADDALQAAITKQRCVAEYNEHRFIISSATHQGLLDPNEYKIRYLDRVCVKGKEEVIRARAQELYYEKRFVDAQVELFKVLARNPTDKVAWHFLVQAAQCLKDGVPETWTGDTVMITK